MPGDSRPIERIDVLVGAYDPRGEPAGERRVQVPAAPAPDPADIPLRFDLAPERYQLRLAVELAVGAHGSVFADVEVPYLRKGAVPRPGVVRGAPADRTAGRFTVR